MGRGRFALTPAERAALEQARREYLAWWDGMPRHKPARYAQLRKHAVAFEAALSEFLAPDLSPYHAPGLKPDLARLLVRMQEAEHSQRSQSTYYDLLVSSQHCARLAAKACTVEIRPGAPPDERKHSWIRWAATTWRAAGLAVRPSGRFGSALAEFKADGVPPVADRDQIKAALAIG